MKSKVLKTLLVACLAVALMPVLAFANESVNTQKSAAAQQAAAENSLECYDYCPIYDCCPVYPSGGILPVATYPVYNGEEQEIITAGQGFGGIPIYSTDGGWTWSCEVPSFVDAGDYPVLTKIVGDCCHYDTWIWSVCPVPAILRADVTFAFGDYLKIAEGVYAAPYDGTTPALQYYTYGVKGEQLPCTLLWYDSPEAVTPLAEAPTTIGVYYARISFDTADNSNYNSAISEPVKVYIDATEAQVIVIAKDGMVIDDSVKAGVASTFNNIYPDPQAAVEAGVIDQDTADAISAALAARSNFKIVVLGEAVTPTAEQAAAQKALVGDKDMKYFYNVSITIYDDEEKVLGTINKLDEPMPMGIQFEKGTFDEKGELAMVVSAAGETALAEFAYADNAASFAGDEFAALYGVAYKAPVTPTPAPDDPSKPADKPSVPTTGDATGMVLAGFGIVALIALAGIIVARRFGRN